MPEWFTMIAAIIALGSGAFALINGYRTAKRTSPIYEVKKEMQDKWEAFYEKKWDSMIERMEKAEESLKSVDGELTKRRFERIEDKLDNDNRRIKAITEASRSQRDILTLLLKAQQKSLTHLSDGNHQGELKKIADEIQDFLLHEATKLEYE